MRPVSSFGSLSSAISRCHPATQRPAGVRPPEWFSKYTIEILDKLQQLLTQVAHRLERPTPDHLPHDHPEHHLDLVQPRTVLRDDLGALAEPRRRRDGVAKSAKDLLLTFGDRNFGGPARHGGPPVDRKAAKAG